MPGDLAPAEEKGLDDLVVEISPCHVGFYYYWHFARRYCRGDEIGDLAQACASPCTPMYWEMFVGAVIIEHICRLLHFRFWRRYFVNTKVDLEALGTVAGRREVVRRCHVKLLTNS